LSTDNGNPAESGQPSHTTDWLTLVEASEVLGVSVRTVRRKVRAGELGGRLVHDDEIGVKRWLVDPETLPKAPGTASVIPIEILDRLEEAWKEAREAHGRAEVATREADFERERRHNIESERDALLAKEQAAEKNADELRTRIDELEGRRWWQRRS